MEQQLRGSTFAKTKKRSGLQFHLSILVMQKTAKHSNAKYRIRITVALLHVTLL